MAGFLFGAASIVPQSLLMNRLAENWPHLNFIVLCYTFNIYVSASEKFGCTECTKV